MNNVELKNIYGGADLTSSLLNAIVKAVNTIYDFGKRFASTIIRIRDGVKCPAI